MNTKIRMYSNHWLFSRFVLAHNSRLSFDSDARFYTAHCHIISSDKFMFLSFTLQDVRFNPKILGLINFFFSFPPKYFIELLIQFVWLPWVWRRRETPKSNEKELNLSSSELGLITGEYIRSWTSAQWRWPHTARRRSATITTVSQNSVLGYKSCACFSRADRGHRIHRRYSNKCRIGFQLNLHLWPINDRFYEFIFLIWEQRQCSFPPTGYSLLSSNISLRLVRLLWRHSIVHGLGYFITVFKRVTKYFNNTWGQSSTNFWLNLEQILDFSTQFIILGNGLSNDSEAETDP